MNMHTTFYSSACFKDEIYMKSSYSENMSPTFSEITEAWQYSKYFVYVSEEYAY